MIHGLPLPVKSVESTDRGVMIRLNDGSQWELEITQRSVGYDRLVPQRPQNRPTPPAVASILAAPVVPVVPATWLPQVNDTVDIVKGPYKGCAAIVVRVDWDDAFPLTLSVIDGPQTAVLQSRLARVVRHQPAKDSAGKWVPGVGDPVRLMLNPHHGQRGVIVALPNAEPASLFYRAVLSDPTVTGCGGVLLLRREFELDPLGC